MAPRAAQSLARASIDPCRHRSIRIAGRLSGGKFEVPRLQSSAASLPPSPYEIRNCDERTRLFRTNRVILPAVNENVIGGHPESGRRTGKAARGPPFWIC